MFSSAFKGQASKGLNVVDLERLNPKIGPTRCSFPSAGSTTRGLLEATYCCIKPKQNPNPKAPKPLNHQPRSLNESEVPCLRSGTSYKSEASLSLGRLGTWIRATVSINKSDLPLKTMKP